MLVVVVGLLVCCVGEETLMVGRDTEEEKGDKERNETKGRLKGNEEIEEREEGDPDGEKEQGNIRGQMKWNSRKKGKENEWERRENKSR